MITKVLELVHQINEETPYNAFFDFSGHVKGIEVRIGDFPDVAYMKVSYMGEYAHLNDGTFTNTITREQMVEDLENFLKEEKHATA